MIHSGTNVDSFDSYWWAAKVVGRTAREKDEEPMHRKVIFITSPRNEDKKVMNKEGFTSVVLCCKKHILRFARKPPEQDCKVKLSLMDAKEWEDGVQMATSGEKEVICTRKNVPLNSSINHQHSLAH